MLESKPASTTSYREIQIGNTLYRVTSFFSGEKDLGKTLEQIVIHRAITEISSISSDEK